MADPNIFAVLIPADGYNWAASAFSLDHNARRYHKPTVSFMEKPSIGSRDPTPEGDDPVSSAGSTSMYDEVPQIRLTFDDGPKDLLAGWAFGTDQASSDVLLGFRGARKVSGKQFTITITDDLRIVLRDSSRYGTAVGYDGRAKDQKRTNYTWTLALAPGTKQHWNEVAIHIPDSTGPAFIIHFPNHRAGGDDYINNLNTYLRERQSAVPTVGAMGLDSALTTAPPTDARTPKQGAVYFDCGYIGKGSCGEVCQVTNTSNGQIYAAKRAGKLYIENPKKRKVKQERRMKTILIETAIMGKLSHENVMKLVDFFETPQLTLVMPYYRHGILEDLCKGYGLKPKDDRFPRYRLKPKDRIIVFIQILLGLAHLHQNGVAHRDLKPSNVVVANKRPLQVVIADFGFAKLVEDSSLMSQCGTLLYIAPEVTGNDYGPKVDVWSLGVLMVSLAYGLPTASMPTDPLQGWSSRWSTSLVDFVTDFCKDTGDNLIHVLAQMIQIDPDQRPNVNQCIELGVEEEEEEEEEEDDDEGSKTPTRQPSHNGQHRGTVVNDGPTTPSQLQTQASNEDSDEGPRKRRRAENRASTSNASHDDHSAAVPGISQDNDNADDFDGPTDGSSTPKQQSISASDTPKSPS
ncbi:MAG: hypothetical protein Q9207_007848 [Kuettlingeria erythrocarpa]